ncbi:unnamed protein product [Prunus armeniaca]|uniref:Uncharacterized protein n=1 Tax=Prunus armeniaca TaxID=36596 RepID=A0A6J5UEF9_PRUAR|nr:unnamed protein product [Prunus armeniaca]
MKLNQGRRILKYKLVKCTAIKTDREEVWAINHKRLLDFRIIKIPKYQLLKPCATYLQMMMPPTVLKLQSLQIGATQNQITHYLVRQINPIEIHGPNRAKTHSGHFSRQCKITSCKAQFFNKPISQNREREIIPVIKCVLVMKIFVDEEVKMELKSVEVGYGGANPRVDMGAVVIMVDEGEAESVDGRIGAKNENAIDELGEELAGIQRWLV